MVTPWLSGSGFANGQQPFCLGLESLSYVQIPCFTSAKAIPGDSIPMQEKIGYNVLVTGEGPGTTTAFYALTGCETPNDTWHRTGTGVLRDTAQDVNDAGCGDGPTGTIHHVSIEGWTLYYQTVWDTLQKDYPATAPVSFGRKGKARLVAAPPCAEYFIQSCYQIGTWVALATMAGSQCTCKPPTVATALDADGATLDFFRNYNVSWHDQSKYFGGISSVNTSLLKPCPETRLVVHEAGLPPVAAADFNRFRSYGDSGTIILRCACLDESPKERMSLCQQFG
eukprot:s2139_g17.t1